MTPPRGRPRARGAAAQQFGNDGERGGISYVVGFSLEGDAEQCNPLARERSAGCLLDPVCEGALARLVGGDIGGPTLGTETSNIKYSCRQI